MKGKPYLTWFIRIILPVSFAAPTILLGIHLPDMESMMGITLTPIRRAAVFALAPMMSLGLCFASLVFWIVFAPDISRHLRNRSSKA